ncbi:zinc-finger domain-containing protein [Paenibacillus methanolicus]|uniref:Uncharacterized protein DUF2602 n=1 Tax=Paenibacillus methanolicus TaxID=582686 RepID=A0A5S5BTJ5_9BACL|nr:zinc-finger domain-containing protein [Paenibacillus methanolicus]TYP68913.1 uncharacterized protein DUF2602 [Paenibacillus methanolicus]
MERLEVMDAISGLLDAVCWGCETRDQLNKMHRSHYAKIDGYCNRQCPVGQQLQSLGRQLKIGPRKLIEEDEYEPA